MNDKFVLKSKDAKKELKISDCKLMHLREDGILRAKKKGNAYMYHEDDVKEFLKTKKTNHS